MTKFLDPSFSSRPASQKYRDNWDATFKKGESNGKVRTVRRKAQHGHMPADDSNIRR